MGQAMRSRLSNASRQKGAVLVLVGMSIAVLIGFLGIVVDLGRLFVTKTELMFVITPRLVKPLPPDYALPTDAFVEPSRTEFFFGGKMEGTPPPAPSKSTPSTQGGFEKK